jgi:hypothetical protein
LRCGETRKSYRILVEERVGRLRRFVDTATMYFIEAGFGIV